MIDDWHATFIWGFQTEALKGQLNNIIRVLEVLMLNTRDTFFEHSRQLSPSLEIILFNITLCPSGYLQYHTNDYNIYDYS